MTWPCLLSPIAVTVSNFTYEDTHIFETCRIFFESTRPGTPSAQGNAPKLNRFSGLLPYEQGLWYGRHLFVSWQRSRRRSSRGARSSLSRLATGQTGMSAGRNLMKWKSRRRDVPKRLEPSLSDGASAEEEGLDRFDIIVKYIRDESIPPLI